MQRTLPASRATESLDRDVESPSASRSVKCRVLLILGHLRKGSFCEAVAEAYKQGLPPGSEIRALSVSEMEFDPDVHLHSPSSQPLEPDLSAAQDLIRWANHLVFVFPTWWGTMPARLKGFLDRVLTPGFGFRDTGNGYEPLLGGRTGHVITTMDTPPLLYRWFFGSPGVRAIARATIWFCGIRPIRVTCLGPVKTSSPERREAWLRSIKAEAAAVASWKARMSRMGRVMSWLKIARLQFYAMTMLAYGLGAIAAAAHLGRGTNWPIFWMGFGVLFLLEFTSVLTNEMHDLPTDRHNERFGPFNGGSRVLVQGDLSMSAVKTGRHIASAGVMACCIGLLFLAPANVLLPAAVLLACGILLGPGYTAPPLQLAWRGWGELDVAVTHSIYMILCGWILQGAPFESLFPWAVSLPMGLAIFASIVLAGIPDFDADRTAGKRTLVVKIGTHRAAQLAEAAVLMAAFVGIGLLYSAGSSLGLLLLPFLGHTAALVLSLQRYRNLQGGCRRIDGLMVLALSYVLWFSLVPFFKTADFIPAT